MDEKQLLQAIAQMIDEKTSGLATREDLAGLATREEMTRQNNETRVLIENSFQKIQNLLEEDYGRVANAVAKTADYDDLKSTVSEHRNALVNHNERLTELEKKAI